MTATEQTQIAGGTLAIDPVHSLIEFAARHSDHVQKRASDAEGRASRALCPTSSQALAGGLGHLISTGIPLENGFTEGEVRRMVRDNRLSSWARECAGSSASDGVPE